MSPVPGVTFRSELPHVVRKELDQFDSELTEYLLQEHDDDGHHKRVTAISIAPHPPGPLVITGPVAITGPLTVDGVPVPGTPAPTPPLAHHATHEPGGSDALANAAWTNQANVFSAFQTIANSLQVDGYAAANAGYYERSRAVPLGEWQSYTPAWASASSPQPAYGTTGIVGRYTVVGRMVTLYVRLIFAGATFGTGSWGIGFPLPAASNGQLVFGTAVCYRASTSQIYAGAILSGLSFLGFSSMAPCTFQSGATHTPLVSPGSPFTWVNGDWIGLHATYEMA